MQPCAAKPEKNNFFVFFCVYFLEEKIDYSRTFMPKLEDLEQEIRTNDDAVEECVQLYLGMTWSEYLKVTDVNSLNISDPRLPSGMVDAAVFLQMVDEKQKMVDECTAWAAACVQKLKEIEEAKALIGSVVQNGMNGFGMNSNAFGMNPKLKAQFTNEHDQAVAQVDQHTTGLWQLSNVKVVDAWSFRKELSVLLKRKLELRISHKKAIALRLMELRGAR